MLTADCKFLISSVLLIKVSVSPAGCAPLPAYLLQYKYKLFLFTFACVCTSVRYNPPPIFSFTVQSLQQFAVSTDLHSLHSICKVCTVSAQLGYLQFAKCRSCLARTLQMVTTAHCRHNTGHWPQRCRYPDPEPVIAPRLESSF